MMVPLLCLDLALASQGTVRDSVGLTVSTDRTTYHVGEPVRLTVLAINNGDTPVRGFFINRPYHDTVEIRYRRVDRPFSRFATALKHSEEIKVLRAPMILNPGHEAKSEFVLSFDATARRFVLDEPGDYEFQVSYRAEPADPTTLLVSNVASVGVSTPPNKQGGAFRQYSTAEIGLLAQYDPLSSSDVDPTVVQSVAELIDKYPSSPYAEAARKGLLGALRQKLLRNQATEAERAVYDRLQQMRPQDR
jgi:hypothetical protein